MKAGLKTFLKVTGISIMLISFAIIPDSYPWYYELLLFNLGLWMWLSTRSHKLRNELKSIFKT